MGKLVSIASALLLTLVVTLSASKSSAALDTEKELMQFLSILVNIKTPLNENDLPAIEQLSKLDYKEIPLMLMIRLDSLITSIDEDVDLNNKRFQLISAIMKSLSETLAPSDIQLLERIKDHVTVRISSAERVQSMLDSASEKESAPGVKNYYKTRAVYMGRIKKRLELYFEGLDEMKALALRDRRTDKKPLNEIPEVLQRWIDENLSEIYNDPKKQLTKDDLTKRIFREDLERIEKYMKERVVDQNEAIEALMKIEYDLYVRGYNREKPRILFLMGLPGVGKDTLAEAYVDAKYNQKGAYKEHLYRMPVVNSRADVWQVIGSAKGFVGSDGKLPEFIRFLVMHQGGRYLIEEKRNMKGEVVSESVVENPRWKPGQILEGFFAPEDAVIFINEGHNWTKQAFDTLLKQAVEKGYIKINSSNGNLEALYTSILFLFASNHGIEELAGRDMNGKQVGNPKTYKELLEVWELLRNDKAALRAFLLSLNGVTGGMHGETLGMSEEFANRILDEDLILLRPLSPEGLRKIFQLKFEDYAESLRPGNSGFGSLNLEISDELIKFAQEFKYNAEEGARPLDNKLQAIMNEVYGAIKDNQITPKGNKHFYLDVERKADGTADLIFKYGGNNSSELFRRQLQITERDRILAKPTFDDFDKLASIPEELKKRIFGNDLAIDQMGKALALTEFVRKVYMANREKHKKATSFLLDGYAGIGKTQTVKELARLLTGTEDFVVFDFNFIADIDKFEEEFVGKVVNGKKIKSRFAQEYDKRKGSTMIVLLEEIGNVHPELLKRLYPFLDEAMNRTFVDKERSMSNVIFISAANISIEIYKEIMEMDLPRDVKMRALSWVYDEFVKDPEARTRVINKKIPEPLRTRFTGIYHYRPVNHEILRNLSQMFLSNSINELKPKDGAIGWEVGFRTEADYHKMIAILESEGFEIENQGRSIRNYLEKNMDKELRFLLLQNRVEDGTKVALVPRGNLDLETLEKNNWKVLIDVYVDGRSEPLLLKMEATERHPEPKRSMGRYKRTAIHEAGHNIGMRLLFPDKMKATFLSIVPGVTNIMNKYIYYAGLAGAMPIETPEYTRQHIVQEIAIDYAGAVAQRLVEKGGVDDAGKHNDMEQATRLATNAVMRFNLSPRFQRNVDFTVPTQVALLSDKEKEIIAEEVNKLLKEGETLAEELLTRNYDLLVNLSNYLLERAVVKTKQIDDFYRANEALIHPIDNTRRASQRGLWGRTVARLQGMLLARRVKNHRAEFVDGIKFSDKIRDLDTIIAEEMAKEFAKAQKPTIPIVSINNGAPTGPRSPTSDGKLLALPAPAARTGSAAVCVALFR